MFLLTFHRITRDPLVAAGLLALLIIAGIMMPTSPLYGQESGSYQAPGSHATDEGQVEQHKELSFTVLTRQQLETPHGSVEFGVMKYSTPDGEECFDTVVAESEALVGKAGGGYCANSPLGPNEDIRTSMGSQLLFFKPPTSANPDLGDSTVSAPPIPYYTTDISGNTSAKVSVVTSTFTIEGVTQSFSVTPTNGAFLIVLPGYIEAPEVRVAALNEKGKVLQVAIVGNCFRPELCIPTSTEP
jgi:hypothetical protein